MVTAKLSAVSQPTFEVAGDFRFLEPNFVAVAKMNRKDGKHEVAFNAFRMILRPTERNGVESMEVVRQAVSTTLLNKEAVISIHEALADILSNWDKNSAPIDDDDA